ncbi:hypothetical protein HDU86_004067 [Geranomyces michiganensis]|nr:hypothetical protein HDU86_004067 [Geranomyces michiganensis]
MPRGECLVAASTSPPSDVARSLSLILTTSPSPFHPSTTLLSTVLESLKHCDGVADCSLTVIFDGYRTAEKGKLKRGRVTADLAPRYENYCIAAHEYLMRWVRRRAGEEYAVVTEEIVVQSGANTSPQALVRTLLSSKSGHVPLRTIRLSDSIGFALAVRTGLMYVETPFTMVLQHDWAFVHTLDVCGLLKQMEAESDAIKYVTFPSTRSLEMGRRQKHHDLPPPTVAQFDIPLLPLYFFADKPHICSTQHYKTRVFGLQIFQRGDFIEDTYGQMLMSAVKVPKTLEGKIAVWRTYGTYIYHAHAGAYRIVRHVNGRNGFEEGGREMMKQRRISAGLDAKRERQERKARLDAEVPPEWEAILGAW